MKDILYEIIAHKRREVEASKQQTPYAHLRAEAERRIDLEGLRPYGSMRQALMESGSGIIAEFKRRSPSKGWIRQDGNAADIPLSYQRNGAAALSILTDEHFFGGNDRFVMTARESGVNIPVLYKNFIIDEYQLLQARLCGAGAVLLIAAALTLKQCRDLLDKARQLGLEVLLEMHSESEMDYAALDPDMCGINNRDLGTFVTRIDNSFRLARLLPSHACKVSESGISSPATVRQLRQAGFNGFLIGENFMKNPEPGASLHEFIAQL